MSARLTPTRIAERELFRLTEREERLIGELQAIRSEQERWRAVLATLNSNDQEATS